MNKNKSFITMGIMGIVFFLLGGTYFLMTTGDDPRKTQEAISFSKGEQITAFEIINSFGSVKFQQEENNWLIAEPQRYRADEKRIETAVSILMNLPIGRILEQPMEEYGFSQPQITITVHTDKNKEKILFVGNKTASMTQYYVKEKDKDFVYLVDSGYIAPFEGSLSSYRDKGLFTVDIEAVDTLTYEKNGKKELTITKEQDGQWRLKYPYEAGARKNEIDDFFVKFKKMNIIQYTVNKELSLQDMGLMPPLESIEIIEGSGRSQILEFGAELNGQRFVRTETGEIAMVFAVDSDFSILNEKKLLYVAPLKNTLEKITGIDIVKKEVSYHLKVDTEKDSYTIQNKEISRGDMASIFLRYINLFASGYDPVDDVLEEPDYVFTSYCKDGTIQSLKLYERDETTYYMDFGEGIQFYMDKERIDLLNVWIKKAMENFQ